MHSTTYAECADRRLIKKKKALTAESGTKSYPRSMCRSSRPVIHHPRRKDELCLKL